MSPDLPHPHRIADRTSPEVAEMLEAAGTCIVPLGACEQHGRGMALRTDTTRAELVADLVAQRMNGSVVVAPAIPIGISEHHMGFPGTLTLSASTLMAVVRDVVESLARHGVDRVFILTGHGGNNSAVDVTLGDLRRTHRDLLLAWSGLSPLAADVAAAAGVSAVHGHSGESETSQAMYLDASLVQRDRLARGAAVLDDLNPAGRLSRTSPGIHFPQRYDDLSPVGALGDPREATIQLGADVVGRIVDRLVDFLTTFNTLTATHIMGDTDDQQVR